MAKNQSCGGKFISSWQGEAPKGRESTPLHFQKGQREQDRRLNYTMDPKDGARIWSF